MTWALRRPRKTYETHELSPLGNLEFKDNPGELQQLSEQYLPASKIDSARNYHKIIELKRMGTKIQRTLGSVNCLFGSVLLGLLICVVGIGGDLFDLFSEKLNSIFQQSGFGIIFLVELGATVLEGISNVTNNINAMITEVTRLAREVSAEDLKEFVSTAAKIFEKIPKSSASDSQEKVVVPVSQEEELYEISPTMEKLQLVVKTMGGVRAAAEEYRSFKGLSASPQLKAICNRMMELQSDVKGIELSAEYETLAKQVFNYFSLVDRKQIQRSQGSEMEDDSRASSEVSEVVIRLS